ncbi:hypothetical protein [Peribacillus simplex]|uniref:hypothetical protein n=1 Tax=Peribacillus simplex TaxID=1478 RepID=UPI003D28B62A
MLNKVDWSGCTRLLREMRVKGRHHRRKPRADRPRKASTWSGNQRSIATYHTFPFTVSVNAKVVLIAKSRSSLLERLFCKSII